MFIEEIKPNGFCGGVKKAIRMINENYEQMEKPIYMLGLLVHNKKIVDALAEKGIIICKGNPDEELNTISSGTVIFTAHGISPKTKQKALDKHLNVVDTTCVNVQKVHTIIKNKINENYNVLVIGKETHPEVKGFLGISDNVNVYTNYNNILNKTFIINQTTLNYDELIKEFNQIKENNQNKDIVICEEICNATKVRQNAIKENAHKYDLIIIIGDVLSNNCKSLLNVALNNNTDAIQIETIEDINKYDLSKYEKIGVTAGASTPRCIIDEVINSLQNYDKNKKYISTLNNNDYLKM